MPSPEYVIPEVEPEPSPIAPADPARPKSFAPFEESTNRALVVLYVCAIVPLSRN